MRGVRSESPSQCTLSFRRTRRSVFAATPFIADADLTPSPLPMAGRDWQAVVGSRLLTPDEESARRRHFDRKMADAMSALRRRTGGRNGSPPANAA